MELPRKLLATSTSTSTGYYKKERKEVRQLPRKGLGCKGLGTGLEKALELALSLGLARKEKDWMGERLQLLLAR